MASFRAHLKQVLHLQESPQRTATAFAIGTAIAFCPFYGFHTLLAIGCTWGFRLNFIAVMAGNFINNPWTLIPILGATYWTGEMCIRDRSRHARRSDKTVRRPHPPPISHPDELLLSHESARQTSANGPVMVATLSSLPSPWPSLPLHTPHRHRHTPWPASSRKAPAS